MAYTWVHRFLKPYYVCNLGALLLYLAFRRYAVHARGLAGGRLFNAGELWAWEKQAFGTYGAAMCVKATRMTSIDSFLADVILFGKTTVLLLCWMMDQRVFVWYVVLFVVLFTLLQQPMYDGPQRIEYFTPAALLDRCLKPGRTDGVTWVVTFYAGWSPPCVYLEPVVAELSLKYSTEALRFAKLDLGRWPHVGQQQNIQVHPNSDQLPTLIMFDGGKEVARIPHVFADNSVARGRFRKNDIVKGFDLERRAKAPAAAAANKKTK